MRWLETPTSSSFPLHLPASWEDQGLVWRRAVVGHKELCQEGRQSQTIGGGKDGIFFPL